MSGQIVEQRSSYQRGLVLGLTMAEIMILLVFCLLIAMATFLKREETRRIAAEQQLEQQVAQNERTRDVVATLQKSGVSVTQLREGIANAAALRASGIDADKAIRDSDLVAAIHRAMAKPGEPPVTTQAILDTIARGQTAAGPGGHQWPPIIRMSEADGYFFKSGSAELSPSFHQALIEQTPIEILKYIQKYDVDVIEVVGHTDERPIGNRQYSNLDRELLPVLKN